LDIDRSISSDDIDRMDSREKPPKKMEKEKMDLAPKRSLCLLINII